jgi:hypothetical protein
MALWLLVAGLAVAVATILSQFATVVCLYMIYRPTENELLAFKPVFFGARALAGLMGRLVVVAGFLSQFPRLRLKEPATSVSLPQVTQGPEL